jgi:predicted dehydrogenase
MAKTVLDCKQMVRAARKTGKYLAVGHQRHYSYLYANALEIVRQKDVIGDIKHIRAFWHRNQTGGGKPGAETGEFDGWHRSIAEEDKKVDFAKYGYKSLEELVRWRLYARTGGGLMVELGSHQLDAVGIFLSEVLGRKDPKAPPEPVHPLAVSGVGITSYFTDGREVEDHIFLTYEFPQNTVVTYSSICTNEFEQYGEMVLGTKGTLAVLSEKDVYVFKEKAPKDTRITWAEKRIGEAVATSTSTAQWVVDVGIPDTLASRGYREEQEHLAWLIRNPGHGQPRCSGEVALGDAVVTLASNVAMHEKRRIEFKKEWFDVGSDAGPENG